MAPIKSSKDKRIRPKLTSTQKEARRQKFLDLTNAICDARESYQGAVKNISEKHRRSEKWTRQQLFLGRVRRRANPWNAFLRQKLIEANAGREAGDRYRLPDFVTKKGSSLKRQYQRLSETEKKDLTKDIEAVREQRVKVRRANPKAVQHDVNGAFSSMEREWTAIMSRTGIEGFYMAVRGSVEDYHEPKLFFSDKALRFVKDVLGIEPQQLSLKFEAWCVSGLDKAPQSTRAPTRSKIISRCRTMIQEKLDEILHDSRFEKKGVEMNYRNYEGKIVEKHGVVLKGWPTTGSKPGVCNPAAIGGRPQLEKLLAALESGRCHWVFLTEDELEERKKHNQAREERGEQVYRPRKSTNRHRNSKGVKSAETIQDDDEEDDEGNSEHEPATSKKRPHIDDEDGGEHEPATKRTRNEDDGTDDEESDSSTDNLDEDSNNNEDGSNNLNGDNMASSQGVGDVD